MISKYEKCINKNQLSLGAIPLFMGGSIGDHGATMHIMIDDNYKRWYATSGILYKRTEDGLDIIALFKMKEK